MGIDETGQIPILLTEEIFYVKNEENNKTARGYGYRARDAAE